MDASVAVVMNRFNDKEHKLIAIENDPSIGEYKVYAPNDPRNQSRLILKRMQAAEFDATQLESAYRMIAMRFENINEVVSIINKNLPRGEFHLVLRQGQPFSALNLTESQVLVMIHQIATAVNALELKGFHYPTISRRYLCSEQSKFSLVSPFAFPGFVRELFLIYDNPVVGMGQRRAHLDVNIKRNILEFTALVASIANNLPSEFPLINDQRQLQGAIEQAGKRHSPFLGFLLNYMLSAPSFNAILGFITNNEKNFIKEFQDYLAGTRAPRISYKPAAPEPIRPANQSAAPSLIGIIPPPAKFGPSFSQYEPQGNFTPQASHPLSLSMANFTTPSQSLFQNAHRQDNLALRAATFTNLDNVYSQNANQKFISQPSVKEMRNSFVETNMTFSAVKEPAVPPSDSAKKPSTMFSYEDMPNLSNTTPQKKAVKISYKFVTPNAKEMMKVFEYEDGTIETKPASEQDLERLSNTRRMTVPSMPKTEFQFETVESKAKAIPTPMPAQSTQPGRPRKYQIFLLKNNNERLLYETTFREGNSELMASGASEGLFRKSSFAGEKSKLRSTSNIGLPRHSFVQGYPSSNLQDHVN